MQTARVTRYVVRWIFVALLCGATLQHEEPHPHHHNRTKLPLATVQLRTTRTLSLKVTDAIG